MNYMYFVSILFLYLFVPCFASQEPQIPSIKSYGTFFVDTTNTIDHFLLTELEQQATLFEKIGFQLAGLFVNTTQKSTVQLATEFGNKNGIGSVAKDNGIAIAVCLEKTNARGQKPTIGVAVGKGLEGLLNDAKIGRFLDDTFVKERAQGSWQKGLLAFVQKTYRYLEDPKAKEFADATHKRELPTAVKVLFLALLIMIFILWMVPKGPKSGRPRGPFFFGGGRYGGNSGGFGGGRGGGFGGGGASR